MRIIGILGGVASGKSMVARQFARLGAECSTRIRAGHEVLRLPHIEAAVRRRWGEAVFGPDGRIDRARLARHRVRPGPEAKRERKYLEQLTHPEIARLLEQQADSMAAAGTEIARSSMRPLLWRRAGTSGAKKRCLSRRRGRRGWRGRWPAGGIKEDFAAREGVQESLDRKRARADVIIDNSGSPQRTQAQVEQFWASLIR